MISQLRRRYLSLQYPYHDPIDQQRARLLLFMDIVLMVGIPFGLLPQIITRPESSGPVFILAVIAFSICAISYNFIQKGRLKQSTWLFILMLLLGIMEPIAFPTRNTKVELVLVVMTVPLVAAGILLSRRGLIFAFLSLVGGLIYLAISQLQSTTPITIIPSQQITSEVTAALFGMGIIAAFLFVFVGNLEQTAKESLQQIVNHRWIAQLNAELSHSQNENDLLTHALSQIAQRLDYVFAQIFLLDERSELNYSIRPGVNNQAIIESVNLQPGDASIVSEAMRNWQPATVTSNDVPLRRSHMQAISNSGAAIPIIYENELIGVLDVQSSRQSAFTQNDINLLLMFTGELALTLKHYRKLSALQRTIKDQQITAQNMQAQLQKLQRQEGRSLNTTWGQYIQGRGKQAIGYNMESNNTSQIIPATDLPENILSTLKEGKLFIETNGPHQTINVPITFRDTTLGAMTFTIPSDRLISDRQIEMAQVVAERLALALENTRLFEQSQAQASRERKASEITGLMIGATDVRAVLNLAAESFNEALGAIHTHIYIQPDLIVEPSVRKQKEEAQ